MNNKVSTKEEREVPVDPKIVIAALIVEIQELAENAKRFIRLRDEAETSTKRNLYNDKLTKNNKLAAEMIEALEALINDQTTAEEALAS